MKVKQLTLMSILTAAITLLTMGVSLKISQGFMNFGDILVMSFGLLFAPQWALLAGIGAALADILLGYGQYAIFTFIIKGLEAFMIALLFRYTKKRLNILYFILVGIWMALGYFVTEIILYGSITIALPNLPYNLLQGLVSAVIAYLIQPLVLKLKFNYFK